MYNVVVHNLFYFAGTIKCTLHRDAWSTFSAYIISDYCALVLWKPTVLTTGNAYKKHYLNITLSNIYAIYSSAVLKEEDRVLPDGYLRVYGEDLTVIKIENVPESLGNSLFYIQKGLCFYESQIELGKIKSFLLHPILCHFLCKKKRLWSSMKCSCFSEFSAGDILGAGHSGLAAGRGK